MLSITPSAGSPAPNQTSMPSYDESQADCWVLIYKEGLLSPVAHDLRLRVTRFQIQVEVDEASLEASFDTSSLCVDTPMKNGVENPGALSVADMRKIAEQIREEVLHSERYPQARFRSHALNARPDGGYDLSGELTLHGVTRPLVAATRADGLGQRLEVTLHQPDFGIRPYRAMLGTLKIQSDVKIRIALRDLAQRA
jgi:YceI-like protein